MATYKVVDADQLNADMTSVADSIRTKGGTTEALAWPDGYKTAIEAIQTGGGGGSTSEPLDPVEVYNNTRPADWMPMPTPAENEMYLLFHIPDGVSSLLAFTVTCTGNYTVALGTVSGGSFVASSSVDIASGSKYETELFADDYGNLTSDGHKQVMVKVSGTDILTWVPSTHSKKTSPSNFAGWNIVEIACRLPSGTRVVCGSGNENQALKKLRYFVWYGKNAVTFAEVMFGNCYSLTAIPQLDTSAVTAMGGMFLGCTSLTAIPQLDTSAAEDMGSMFSGCYSLTAVPQMDTSAVTNMGSMFNYCYSLTAIAFNGSVTGWAGYAVSLKDCSLGHAAIVAFFNSLPTITSAKAITLTGNPGVSELTDAEKAIATGKGWTLTL